MRKSALLLVFASLALTSPASADLRTARLQIPDAELVGEGRLKFLFWSVFDATLYAPDGVWSDDKPFALSLSYLRDLEGKSIVEASIDEMRKQGMTDDATLQRWGEQMAGIFLDVDDRTTLTGVVDENGDALFYRNGEPAGAIRDPEFSRRFFDIWLGEKTSNPELRAQLIGSASS
ncbi:MAG: chalcone isomerase family protein [Pseudomonadota bacterium]